MKADCLTCQYNEGLLEPPGGRIREYDFWILEHINEPVPVLGWLVLKTKRHVDGVAGMNEDEARELGEILSVIPKLQKELCAAEQVYIICFTEVVSHLHFHLIPRHINETRKGPKLFELVEIVKKDDSKAVSVHEVIEFSSALRERL